MKTNRKILVIIGVMLVMITSIIMGIVAINFRDYAYQNLEDKSKIIAEIVRDGLTAHMINGMMDKRSFFLQNISNSKDVEALWIVRSPKVVEQFGEGYSSEHPRDEIDKNVLKTGETYKKIDENSHKVSLRVSVPYTASSYGNPNCLDCHSAKEGDVLGAISMTFDITDIRQLGAITIAKILGTSIIFLVLVIFATNYLIKPYLVTLESVRKIIQKAFQGDFSHRVTVNNKRNDEAGEVARWLNTLFDKFQATLGTIEHNISLFIPHNYVKTADPLEQSKIVIEELADIYRFKKTIELDRDKMTIYDRIFFILKEKFKMENFAFYEVNYAQNIRKLVYITKGRSYCEGLPDSDVKECRTYRTDAEVLSDEFHKLCPHFNCENRDMQYFCTTFKINSDMGIIITATTESLLELERIQKLKPLLVNYLEAAKPVLESKILMDILKESSLRDTLTGLYNRRFLEEFIDKATSQAIRTNVTYAIMMIDIDFFKMVNDTYGHDVGDVVIRALGKVISTDIRASDLAIRYGGEELVILLHNSTEDGAMKVAEKIKNDFGAQKFKGGSEVFQKTLSIGISMFPSDADSLWKCIKFADIALYKAKESGRNKILKFDTKMFPNGQDY